MEIKHNVDISNSQSPLVRLKGFFIESDVSRLFTESELGEVQAAPLSVLDLQSQPFSLLLTDLLPQLAVGDGEAPVRVLAGHLVLIVESHAVGGTVELLRLAGTKKDLQLR